MHFDGKIVKIPKKNRRRRRKERERERERAAGGARSLDTRRRRRREKKREREREGEIVPSLFLSRLLRRLQTFFLFVFFFWLLGTFVFAVTSTTGEVGSNWDEKQREEREKERERDIIETAAA